MKAKITKEKLVFVIDKLSFFVSHRYQLAKFLSSRYEIYVVSENDLDKKIYDEISSKINLIDFPSRNDENKLRIIQYVIKLRKQIIHIAPSYIFFITLEKSTIGILACMGIKDIKSFLFITGIGETFRLKTIKSRLVLIICKILFSFIKSNDRFEVIFQNDSNLNFFKNNRLIDNGKIIKGSSIDEDKFSNKNKQSNGITTFIFSGRLVYAKGIDELVNAVEDLSKLYDNFIVNICGNYDIKDPDKISEELFNRLLQNRFINYKGLIDHEDMHIQLCKADVFILPSYGEGLPVSALEAMKMQLPLIMTNVSGCKECVIDSVNGFLIPRSDHNKLREAMEFFINNNQQIEIMGKMSEEIFYKEFSKDRVLKQYLELLN